MRRWMAAAALATLPTTCGSALGDGMLIVPDKISWLFAEQMQEAVVEVHWDRTATVDLFISLLDKSGKEHEVPFLLPFQTMPEDFEVDEIDRHEFGGADLSRMYRMVERANLERAYAKARALATFVRCSLAGGPLCAGLANSELWVPWSHLGRHATFGAGGGAEPKQLSAVEPALSVTTEHARVDVYPALKPEQVASLASLPRLPAGIARALKRYAGRPFALVRLRTIAGPAAGRADTPDYAPWEPEPHPGIRLHFVQDVVGKSRAPRYDYPLGTGEGWRNPIPTTRVWVTAPDTLRLGVHFPPGYGERFDEAAAGRQVHVATYRNARPRRDVRIRFLGSGRSLAAAKETRMRVLYWSAWVAFALLAVLLWLAAFRLVVWRNPVARRNGFWLGAVKGWGAQALALVPLFYVAPHLGVYARYHAWYYSGVSPFPTTETGQIAALLLLISWLIGFIWATVALSREAWGFVGRSALAAVIAAVLYSGVGTLWLLLG